MKKDTMLKQRFFLILTLVALLLTACTLTPTPTASAPTPGTSTPAVTRTELRIGAMRGPTAMGLVKLMQDAENGETDNDYLFTLAGAADELSAALLRGELDIVAVPVNLASLLYNRSEGGVIALALNTLGGLYLLEDGDSISSVEDLRGKTIFSTGKGTTPEFSLNYILTQNGISLEEVTIDYRSEATEIAALLEQGMATIAVLPEPYVTSVMAKNDKLRVALGFAVEWEKVSSGGASLVAGATIVRSGFLAQHKDAIEIFMSEYEASVAYTESHPAETAALIADIGIIPNANLAAIALPKCNVVYRIGDEMQRDIGAYLQVLFEANPASVGGALPGDDFYYHR